MTKPRLAPLTPEEAPPDVRPIFTTYLQERGNIPNMFRTVAVRPKHLQTMIAHFRTVMNEGTVPPLLKELLWVRVSHWNQCHYCLNSHTVLARRRGASEALLDALQERGSRVSIDELEPGWRAALAYADVMHGTGHDVTDPLFGRLREVWDEGQIVEISLVIGMAEYFNRFNNALRVEPTK
ncbi:MAG TPA: carboxymuconolactone decarboxylase family protein [Gemmatimonadales bacterium]|nr:carboxymuconolactone decarboxylase family protein [Gemmatimonadales bacterium]